MQHIYLIVDGGYIDIPELISGFKYSSERVEYKFTDWIASVRKDVECLFGILKARIRYLRNSVLAQTQESVDDAFITCCILHNMRDSGNHDCVL